MNDCLLIINTMSGNGDMAHEQELAKVFGNDYIVDTLYVTENTVIPSLSQNKVVVCGGDGTLNSILNTPTSLDTEIFYIPYGTLNELSSGDADDEFDVYEIGEVNGKRFSYVMACGIFTPLGYVVDEKKKKRFKKLAYIAEVLREYKIHRIKADISVDGVKTTGEYSLIMAIDSPCCFGFKFNKAYRFDDGKMHLLTIKAPKGDGLFAKMKIFFPLFRAFFMGFKKDYKSKNMQFKSFEHANIDIEETPFDLDGERMLLGGNLHIGVKRLSSPIKVIKRKKMTDIIKRGETR